jgi:multidrug efflux pump subunit AcrA (membrane-fusion protein)
MTGSKGDAAAKIIVIMLIMAFLGVAAYSMLGENSGSAGAAPGAAPYGGAGASQAGMVQGGQNSRPANASPNASPAGQDQAGRGQEGGAQGGQSRGQQPVLNAITVSAKTIEGESVQQVIKLNGDVSSQSAVSVFPDTSGKIIRILKNLGDTVRQGDVIAYVDPSRPGAAYVESPVVSPVEGTITSLPVTGGLTVSQSTVIATIGSLDRLKITIYVAEKYSSYLRQNLPAYVSFSSAPGVEFNARVSTVSPVVNNKNRTIETTLNLASQDPRIKEGMFASVRLVIREERNAMVIPRSAIKDYNGEDTVYIIDGEGAARRVPVQVGLTNDLEAQILSGLNFGDQVITAGAVTDGSPVRISTVSL